MSTRYGFLLIEIMIALTLFATVSIVIAHYYCRTVSTQSESRMYCQATNVARTLFESIIHNQAMPDTLPDHKDQCALTWNITPGDIPNFTIVELHIAWDAAIDTPRSITYASAFYTPNGGGR